MTSVWHCNCASQWSAYAGFSCLKAIVKYNYSYYFNEIHYLTAHVIRARDPLRFGL